ncbi:MAG: hypothetical protein IJ934_04180 [Acetobacter sp.]|nr:hypothetical protein [Acetobacter sp.]
MEQKQTDHSLDYTPEELEFLEKRLGVKISYDMADADMPGVLVAVTPAEAERLGMFKEDAVSLEDVLAAATHEEN